MMKAMTMTMISETKNQSIKPHYVDNDKFYQALVEYRQQVDEAKRLGLEKPRVSEYIGECFLKIAVNLSYKSNFINYTYRDDMISDGIENCLTSVEKFDPEKGKNPFAYYTQVNFWAFVRRILKEKKKQALKYKMLEQVDIDQLISHAEGDAEFITYFMDLVRKQVDTIEPDRRGIKKEKTSKKRTKKADLPIE
jgi:hypothetical protein